MVKLGTDVGIIGNIFNYTYLTTNFPEFLGCLAVRDDLSRTDEGEVQGVEEKHQVFALEVRVGLFIA